MSCPKGGEGAYNFVYYPTIGRTAPPPPGITVISSNATQNSLLSYDYEMSLSIQNLSLLYSTPILCDGGTPADQVMTSCSPTGEYVHNITCNGT